MGPKSAAAATASTPAKSVTTEAEPSLADLGALINSKPLPAAKPAKAKPAKAATEDPDHDPEFDADEDETIDPAAPAAGDNDEDPYPNLENPDPETEIPDPAAPAAEDLDPESQTPDPALSGLDAEDKATRQKLTPDQQKSFDKAVQKRARQNAELKTQLAERDQALEQLAAAPAVAATPTAENPLADVEDEAALATRIKDSRALWRWARLHPNGGQLPDGTGKEIEITAERALEISIQEEELQNFHAPAREKFLKTRSEQEAAAVQAHPWLKNKTSQGAVEIEATLRRNPGLRSVPGIKLILADSLAGRAVRLTKTTATAAGVAGSARKSVPVAPATPAGRTPPPRVASAVKTAATAQKTVVETGKDPGNAALGALIRKR